MKEVKLQNDQRNCFYRCVLNFTNSRFVKALEMCLNYLKPRITSDEISEMQRLEDERVVNESLRLRMHTNTNTMKVCKLCKRQTPLYFWSNSEQFNRLQDRAITPLLKDMKVDSTSNQYLKYFRVKQNFIKPCNCKNNKVHAYCMTARIVYDKKINCEQCRCYYKLSIKKEKWSGKFLQLCLKYVMIMIVLLLAAFVALIQDAYLKHQYAKKNPEAVGEYIFIMKKKYSDAWFSFQDPIDWREPFSIWKSIYWVDMIYISIILAILQTWCFSINLSRAYQ